MYKYSLALGLTKTSWDAGTPERRRDT